MLIKMKICLVGAFAVGKTSLIRRYVHSLFSEKYHTTVGVKIDKKTVNIDEQTSVELIIWDLYGEDDFLTVRMSYLRGASGIFFVADGTRGHTLKVALDLQRRAEESVGRIPFIIALNKHDLEGCWEIDASEEARLSEKGVPVVKTSAKSGEAVENAFATLTQMMLEKS